MMAMRRLGWAALGLLMALPARAAAPVEIGMITTLSGPGGYLGEDVRDGFNLAIAEEGGTLGGVPVKVLVEDDGLKPGNGKQIAARFLESDKIRIVTGIIFSNVAEAVVPDVLAAGAFYLSPNAAPSNFSGKGCNKDYFVVSWQNDVLHESAGANANRLGFKRMFVLAPNYQAGRDAITGFKRTYKGKIVGELYTSLNQTDFSSELAQIRAAKPDAVFQFEPGGLGIAFLKQYVEAGLKDTIPMVVAFPSMDQRILAAVGDAALGLHVSYDWNTDFTNPASQRFVADFEKTYHRVPTYYASQGYDTARLLASGLKAVHGDVSETDALRAALRKADFVSVRGYFKFAQNQHPIEDWYAGDVVRGPDGKPEIKTVAKILTHYVDAYAKDCHM